MRSSYDAPAIDMTGGPISYRVVRVIARMNAGGPAQQVSALTAGLERFGFETRLVTGSVSADEIDYRTLRGRSVDATSFERLGRAIGPIADSAATVQLIQLMREFEPHIVHTHTAKAGVLGRVAATITGVPVLVHTFHGHLLRGYFTRPVSRAVVGIESALARRTTMLMSVGSAVRDELLAAGIGRPDQFVVMPPGVFQPTAMPRDLARRELGLAESTFVVAFVARLTGVKRPDRLLEVARRLSEQLDDVCFLVAGGGELLNEMKMAARNMGDVVRFLGWRGDVERIYAAADVLLLTSDNEGMPVAVIEAGMCGTPAVATDVGSVSEVIESGVTGVVCPPDVESLTSGLAGLAGDGIGRRAMGEAARSRYTVRFAAERLVADTAAAYRRVLEGVDFDGR